MKEKQLQLTGANGRGDRRELDFYPTPPECTVALLKHLQIPTTDTIWEPACGSGAMSSVMESMGYTVFSTDISSGYGQSLDFLADGPAIDPFDWIITNPPFNLSEEFIIKSLAKAKKGVAMLLKSQYWHAKRRLPLFNRHSPSWVLPLTWRPDFLSGDRGGKPTMEMAWTVWEKDEYRTTYQPLEKPIL